MWVRICDSMGNRICGFAGGQKGGCFVVSIFSAQSEFVDVEVEVKRKRVSGLQYMHTKCEEAIVAYQR
jgi:hypothetical protein